MRTKVLIMGAAGRDFHNFNTFFRNNEDYEVVAFTAAQIPDIDGREYPSELAGDLYPDGIPIRPESELEDLIGKRDIDQVVFSYSDVSHEHVMNTASRVNAAGADFRLLGTDNTTLESEVPLVTVTAVRTGCGKSQTTRQVCDVLQAAGKDVVVIRHPMPYGDLAAQRVQRYENVDDLDKHNCTIEEREEFEPHIDRGIVVYAGVDYEEIIEQAQKEADVVVWDGGNNDTPFYTGDINIVVADPHRAGHELTYYPGETNFRRADVIVINKMTTAPRKGINTVRRNISAFNPGAKVIEAASPITVENPDQIKGKKVLVIEDGPTLTHGEMKYGAGVVAAQKYQAAELVDPRPYTVDSIKEVYKQYPEIGTLLPAMGYGEKQVKDLEKTINNTECDLVIVGTPIDLRRLVDINKPALRVQYELDEIGTPDIKDVLGDI